jgi:uncharacterized protein (TIGR02268 family)
MAGPVIAQPQPFVRERQDRRTSLALTPTELRVAGSNVTTIMLNGPLDRDSLVVDRTRFKWAEVSDQILILQPVTDLGSGERLVAKVNFKDRAVPAQAVFVVITHPTEMDGTVEVDRRANTPEALIAALAERDAQVETLRARCEVSVPIAAMRSGLLGDKGSNTPIAFKMEVLAANGGRLEVKDGTGYEGTIWALSTFVLHNPPGSEDLDSGLACVDRGGWQTCEGARRVDGEAAARPR